MNLEDITTDIYVINLKKREDRKKHIINQLDVINCKNYVIVEAVDLTSTERKFNIKGGAQGLVETWKIICDTYKQSNSEYIVIIEDDCEFVADFNEKLEEYLLHIPEDWHIVYFGANHNYHTGFVTKKVNDWCLKLNNSYSSHCLLLKKDFFFLAIDYLEKNKLELDVALSNLQKLYNAYSPTQKLASQIAGFSDIEKDWVDYSKLIS